MSAPTERRVGDLVNQRYELLSMLGSGGLGVVWRAHDLQANCDVAIKFLHSDPLRDGQPRFENEARALAQLDHPSIVRLLEFGHEASGDAFIAMGVVHGRAMARLHGTAVPWRHVVNWMAQLADGLAQAHERGIVHRDLKPENVLFADDASERECVRIVDFGLAKLTGREQADITKTGEIFGTPMYMSPEQLRGSRSVTASTDLYAVGVMMYELLEGRAPFHGSTPIEIAMKHLVEPAPPVTTDCPPALRDLVASLLQKDPADRPPGAVALANELRRIEMPGRPSGQPAPASTPPLAIATSVGVAIVIALGAWFMLGRDAPTPDRPATPVPQQRAYNPLLRGSAPPPDVVSTMDAGASVAELIEAPAPPAARTGPFQWNAKFSVVVPTTYAPDDPAALVVFLHEKTQDVQKDTRFAELAQREGFIFAYVHGGFLDVTAWDLESDRVSLHALLEELQDAYAIHPDRIFAVGHVSGGYLAEELPCGFPEFDAIATMATRGRVGQKHCGKAIPYLHLAPMKDGYNPIEGGLSCHMTTKISLADHEALWKRTNGCRGRQRDLKGHKSSDCVTWECDTAFEVCHLDGGHNWPHAGRRALDLHNCDGVAADFPFEKRIWEFFKRQSAGGDPPTP